MSRIWMRPSPGRHAAPARATARSRCARSGAEPGPLLDKAGAMSEADELRGDTPHTGFCGGTPHPREGRGPAEGVARRSSGKLVALLGPGSRNFSAAEEALSEAFPAALASWPRA